MRRHPAYPYIHNVYASAWGFQYEVVTESYLSKRKHNNVFERK